MPDRPAPSVRARQLARELRRLREAAQLTGEAAAAQLGWSSAKVSRIETARSLITVSDLRRLLDLYGARETDVDRLEDLARTSRERGWWDTYVGDAPVEFATYLGLETEATGLSLYSAVVVPGLLQTEEYARALIKSLLLMPPAEAERLVQLRRIRQDRVYRAHEAPLILHIVLDESALRRQVGGPDVLRDQLKQLIRAADLPNVELRVLPYSAGAHPAVSGGFHIFKFPRLGDPEIVGVELFDSHLFIEGEKEVYRYTLVFNEISAKAFTPPESLAFIKQILSDP